MKILFLFALVLFTSTLAILPDAEARRFGGGQSLGKQFKSMPRTAPRQTQEAAPGSSRTAANAAGSSSGASRWLGPLARLIREEQSATADPFREVWHVQHDWESSAGDWLISGVQQA